MDEDTIIKLADAAKQIAGIRCEHPYYEDFKAYPQEFERVFPHCKYPFQNVSTHPILVRIHQYYIDWNDPKLRPAFAMGYDESDFKKAEIAIKRFKIALRDCGRVGEKITDTAAKSLGDALEWTSQQKKGIEDFKKWAQKKDIEIPYSRNRGNPGNWRLRVYITQMAQWYAHFVRTKPAYGTSSKFPKLIRKCLAAVDEDRVLKDPPYKAIKNVLKLLSTSPNGYYHQQFWRYWHRDLLP